MKFSSSQLAYLIRNREARGNLRALLKYVLTLLTLITLYAVVFHLIKVRVEGEEHSWITGFYWTLVVMTTLGFGDITFTSDIGRVFSIIVLLSGVVLLLVMLPFMFISLFYAPWLEARVRLRAPREVPEGTRGHVILTEYDAVAIGLIERLKTEQIPYCVIEPDPVIAARLIGEGIRVIAGNNDSSATYQRLNAKWRPPAARQLRGYDEHQHHDHGPRDCPRFADRGDCRGGGLHRRAAAERRDDRAGAQAPARRVSRQPR